MVLSIKASMTPGLIGMGDELHRLCVRVFLAGGVERLQGGVDVCGVCMCADESRSVCVCACSDGGVFESVFDGSGVCVCVSDGCGVSGSVCLGSGVFDCVFDGCGVSESACDGGIAWVCAPEGSHSLSSISSHSSPSSTRSTEFFTSYSALFLISQESNKGMGMIWPRGGYGTGSIS